MPLMTEEDIFPVPINPNIIKVLYQRIKKKPPKLEAF